MDTIVKPTYRDNYFQFGIMTCINRVKLNNNIILLKYVKNLGPINNFKQTKITNELKYFIIDILDTNKINVDTQKKLSNSDIVIFEKLLHATKMTSQLKYTKYISTIEDHIQRFNLLRSAISAGNQAVEIKNELIDLITLLSSPLINKINKSDANEFILMLSE